MKRLGTDGLLCCSEMGNIAPPGGTKNPVHLWRGVSERCNRMGKEKQTHEHTHMRDKEATRQRILDAAEEVFAEKGYHGAVVDDIVRTADMSKGGFYFHFPNKQGIFLALMEALTPRLISTAERAIAQETDPVAKVDAALRTVLDTFSRHRRLSKI